jgi:hypothetical protein
MNVGVLCRRRLYAPRPETLWAVGPGVDIVACTVDIGAKPRCWAALLMEETQDDEGVLRHQMAELENSIAHLQRSNSEMEQVLKEEGPDPELRTAIGENIVAIARRKAILEDLQKQFPGASAGAGVGGAASMPTAVATEESEPGISL